MRHFLIILFAAAVFFSSCSYKQDQALFEQRKSSAVNPAAQSIADAADYRIKPQDILQITNVQNNKTIVDLSAGVTAGNATMQTAQQADGYQVEEDGTIALPALGRLQIAGLTRVEARKRIEEAYSKELKQPLLDVKIINLKVNVTGEVRSPGNFLLTKDKTTLIEILGEAGGLTEKSDEKTIKIIRRNQNSKVDILDLSDIGTLSDPRIIVQNNDIVYVSQNKRAVRNSGIQNFFIVAQPVLLLFNTALIIFTLARK